MVCEYILLPTPKAPVEVLVKAEINGEAGWGRKGVRMSTLPSACRCLLTTPAFVKPVQACTCAPHLLPVCLSPYRSVPVHPRAAARDAVVEG